MFDSPRPNPTESKPPSKASNFDTEGFRLVQDFSDHEFGFLVRNVYSALSSDQGKVAGLWDGEISRDLIFGFPDTFHFQRGFPGDESPDILWKYSQSDDEFVKMLERERLHISKEVIRYEEQANYMLAEVQREYLDSIEATLRQIGSFSPSDIRLINMSFAPELQKLRAFQEETIREIVADFPTLNNLQKAAKLVLNALATSGGRTKVTRPLTPSQLRAAAINKTYEFSSQDPQGKQEYERMIHKTMLSLDEVLEETVFEPDTSQVTEHLVQALAELLRELYVEAGEQFSDFFVFKSVNSKNSQEFGWKQNIHKFRINFDEPFTKEFFLEGIGPVSIKPSSRYYCPHFRKTDELGFMWSQFVAFRNENFFSKKNGKEFFFLSLLKIVESEICELILHLQNPEKMSKMRLLSATELVLEGNLHKNWEEILAARCIETEITPENFSRIVAQATVWGVFRNGHEFYSERAKRLGYEAKDNWQSRKSRESANLNFSSFLKDSDHLSNTSRERMARLEKQPVFSITAHHDFDPQFIEIGTSLSSGVEDGEEKSVESNSEKILHLQSEPILITTGESEMNIPGINGLSPVSIQLIGAGNSWDFSQYSVFPDGSLKIKLPSEARNQTQLRLDISYSSSEVESSLPVQLSEQEMNNLYRLEDELRYCGFQKLSEAIVDLIKKETVTDVDLQNAVKEVSQYSYNSTSANLGNVFVLESLSSFLDPETGLFLCQCDSANELLLYCLGVVFDNGSSVFVSSYGFSAEGTVAGEENVVSKAMAHRQLKHIRNGVVSSLDATPEDFAQEHHFEGKKFENDRKDEKKFFVLQQKKAFLQHLEKRVKSRQAARNLFSDRSAPIPRLFELLNTYVEFGFVDMNRLLTYKESIDLQSQKRVSDNLAKKLGLNCLSRNLDIYAMLSENVNFLMRLQS